MKTTKKTKLTTKTDEPKKDKTIDVWAVVCGKGPHRVDILQKKLREAAKKCNYVSNCVGIETLEEFAKRLQDKSAIKNAKTFVDTFRCNGQPVNVVLVNGRIIRYQLNDIPGDCRHVVTIAFGTNDQLKEYCEKKSGVQLPNFIRLAAHEVIFGTNWIEIATGYGRSKRTGKYAVIRIFAFDTVEEPKKPKGK